MPNACCCYVIDAGYLFPTLLSAIQARSAVAVSAADVTIFCVGEGHREIDLFEPICRERGIGLVSVPPSAIDHMPIMFGRFYLARLLGAQYEAIVYLDGDTQVAGSLQPLVTAHLEPNRFLAVRDPMSIMIDGQGKVWRERRAYFRQIGIGDLELSRYCNSGVIRFNRSDWEAMSRAALRTSARHDHGLRFPDQDALNLTFGSDYLTMSYRWNFPSFFLSCGLQDLIAPNIYHFMSNPRPWNGPFRPWGRAWYDPYIALAKEYPQLKASLKPIGCYKVMKYSLQQRLKLQFESPAWRTPEIRERIMRFEAEAYV